MKALRYLLMVMVVTLASVTAQAEFTAQFKNSENKPAFSSQQAKTGYAFYTTSTLMESGSSLPMAAKNGLTISASTPNDDTPAHAPGHAGHIRKGWGSGGEEGEPDDRPDPYETPVGDGMWVLLLLAAGFAAYKTRMRRKETA